MDIFLMCGRQWRVWGPRFGWNDAGGPIKFKDIELSASQVVVGGGPRNRRAENEPKGVIFVSLVSHPNRVQSWR